MNKEISYCLSKRTFIHHCMGIICEMSPACLPRKIEQINVELVKYFNEKARPFAKDKYGKPLKETSGFIDYPMMTRKEIYELVNGIIKIPVIEELNLSNNEYKKGIGVNDESRPKFAFCDRYSKEDIDNDFIDLYALIQNVLGAIMCDLEESKKFFDNVPTEQDILEIFMNKKVDWLKLEDSINNMKLDEPFYYNKDMDIAYQLSQEEYSKVMKYLEGNK